ncbi:hypothetical protein E2P81_ATG02025 [Venturia nashicola]|uniref:Uncharacterized protein n=1 Tax=Venturia nashicola TaxID=86259 RepID=A0A4Z1PLG8_9PEZI|nr:hypothetical protein E6O75_ATG02068 [Venturia nashicola]TLD35722.1 hypothetical protein E2P81_ATG02025 [Venturia nashicola]
MQFHDCTPSPIQSWLQNLFHEATMNQEPLAILDQSRFPAFGSEQHLSHKLDVTLKPITRFLLCSSSFDKERLKTPRIRVESYKA